MIGNRIVILEKFFGIKRPKNINPIDWLEKLHDMEQKWEEEHQESFPV